MALYTIYPTHPDWKNSNMALFDECYDPIVRISYSLRDPQPKLMTIRPTQSKRCAFCYCSDPRKFSHIAHLLPAALGNRHYTSEEECDDCNRTFGEGYENALASMLAAERALYRVRSRKGTARLQPKGTTKQLADEEGRSFVGGDRYDGGLHIHIHESDNSITAQDNGDNTFTIHTRSPSFDSTQALKSILKTFWLSVNDSTREQFQYIRHYIMNDPSLKQRQSEFFKYFLPDAPDAVVFEAWRKRADITTQTSDLVVRLSIAHTSIVWCSPDPVSHAHAPSLLPPVLQNEVVTKLQAEKVLCLADSSVINAHNTSFTFSYNSRVRTIDGNSVSVSELSSNSDDSENHPAEPAQIGDDIGSYPSSIPVSLEAFTGDVLQRITDANIITYRLDRQFMIFRIIGGEFAANLLMQIDLQTQEVAFREDYTFHRYPAVIASQTMDLIMLAYKRGAQLRAIIKGTDQVLFTVQFYRGDEIPNSLLCYQEALSHLRLINSALETDFRVGRQLFPIDLELARRLARIISTGREDFPDQGIHFEIEKEQCKNLKSHIERNSKMKNLTIRQPNCFADFMNSTIDLGPIRIVLSSPSIDNDITEENGKFDGQTSTITLRSTSTTVYYERWECAENSSEVGSELP